MNGKQHSTASASHHGKFHFNIPHMVTPEMVRHDKHVQLTTKKGMVDTTGEQSKAQKSRFISRLESTRDDSIYTNVIRGVELPTEQSEIARKSLAFKVLME